MKTCLSMGTGSAIKFEKLQFILKRVLDHASGRERKLQKNQNIEGMLPNKNKNKSKNPQYFKNITKIPPKLLPKST